MRVGLSPVWVIFILWSRDGSVPKTYRFFIPKHQEKFTDDMYLIGKRRLVQFLYSILWCFSKQLRFEKLAENPPPYSERCHICVFRVEWSSCRTADTPFRGSPRVKKRVNCDSWRDTLIIGKCPPPPYSDWVYSV